MGDALSKPAEPWEDELPASPPAQQVPPVDAAAEQPTPSDRRRVKVNTLVWQCTVDQVCMLRGGPARQYG